MSALLPAAFRADWVFPVGEPPIRDGLIEVDAAGTISALRTGRERDANNLGAVAIVPALVNPHVHLEFSDLAQPILPFSPFPAWLKNVVAHRRQRTGSLDSLLKSGINELRDFGIVACGEIATGESDAFDRENFGAVLFHELIGPLTEHWPERLSAAERHLRAVRSPNVIAGLSPHAPYTVPQELFEQTVRLAVEHASPVAVHLAETAGERDLLESQSGELVEMMRSLDLWRDELHPPGRRPLDWLRTLSAAPRGLVIHGNYLEPDELDFLAGQSNLTLVYCPRTHAAFGHPPHPFRQVLERNGRVALGTDGRSSNPDLDLWQEAVFLRRQQPDLSSGTILELVTSSAADSLGIGGRHGQLAVGRRADFLAIPISTDTTHEPPDLFRLDCGPRRIFRGGIESN